MNINEWINPRNGQVRRYINGWHEAVGIEVEYYNSGNVREAALDGYAISKAAFQHLDAKIWLDENDSIHIDYLGRKSPLSEEELRARIEKALAEEAEAEEAQAPAEVEAKEAEAEEAPAEAEAEEAEGEAQAPEPKNNPACLVADNLKRRRAIKWEWNADENAAYIHPEYVYGLILIIKNADDGRHIIWDAKNQYDESWKVPSYLGRPKKVSISSAPDILALVHDELAIALGA